jgi:hypothetical protein
MEQFYHGLGYIILWIIGMFVIPMLSMLFIGYITDWDEELGKMGCVVAFIIYWIITALFLILK